MSVGSDQHGGGRGDRTNDRKLPWTGISSLDLPDAIRPRRDVEARLTEVEEHWSCIVQEREDPQRAIGGAHGPTLSGDPPQPGSLRVLVGGDATGPTDDGPHAPVLPVTG